MSRAVFKLAMFCCGKFKKKGQKSRSGGAQLISREKRPNSARFTLIDNSKWDDEDCWDLKSVWGKDWTLGRDGSSSPFIREESVTIDGESVSLISFTTHPQLQKSEPYSSTQDLKSNKNTSSLLESYDDRLCSTNTSDTGLCTDSDGSAHSPYPPPRSLSPKIAPTRIFTSSLTSLEDSKIEHNNPVSEIQSLRDELIRERERAATEIQGLRDEHAAEIMALQDAHQAALEAEKENSNIRLAAADRRNQEVRSDWLREREHEREEMETLRLAHVAELSSLAANHQAELESLKETHQAEVEALKLTFQTDLKQQKENSEVQLFERDQLHKFELEELKEKQAEEMERQLESLKSHHNLEIELFQQKLKNQQHHHPFHMQLSSSSREVGLRQHVDLQSSISMGSLPQHNSIDLLKKEITSLSVVVELRNNVIKDLRQDAMSQRLRIEQLEGVEDRNHWLTRRVEDLEAQVKKTRDDKTKLIAENQSMQSSVHEALNAKDKISKELDLIRYRIGSSEPEVDANNFSKPELIEP